MAGLSQPSGTSVVSERLAFDSVYQYDTKYFNAPVSPYGDVGILTMWTPRPTAETWLAKHAPDALNQHGRVAVISQFHGNGFQELLCNLLFNPQIRHLIAIGQDMGHNGERVPEEFQAFLDRGLEAVQVLGRPWLRVVGEQRQFPMRDGFDVEELRRRISFTRLTSSSGAERAATDVRRLLDELPRDPAPPTARGPRIDVRPSEDDAAAVQRPGDRYAQQVAGDRTLAVWEELVVRTLRFGERVTLRSKGPRIELLNARAVIQAPTDESAAALQRASFSKERMTRYQTAILDPRLAADDGAADRVSETVAYTYGNRLRQHFVLDGRAPALERDMSALRDTLAGVVRRLAADRASRKAYVTLWDNAVDLPNWLAGTRNGDPCLVTLFFRVDGAALSLTATYRTHNLLDAWVENVHGLFAIQRHVALAVGLDAGPVSVISHSLTIDPGSPRYELAEKILKDWTLDQPRNWDTGKRITLRGDPNGDFRVSVRPGEDGVDEIVAEHLLDGAVLREYRGSTASKVINAINTDMAVSLPSHGLWLGAELVRAEQRLEKAP